MKYVLKIIKQGKRRKARVYVSLTLSNNKETEESKKVD